MRHRRDKQLDIHTGVQKRDLVLRQMLTNLVSSGRVVTTSKRALVLKAYANSFFSGLVSLLKNESTEDANRRIVRQVSSVLFGEEAGRKVVSELLPKYKEAQGAGSYVSDYKLGKRPGDGAEKVLVSLL